MLTFLFYTYAIVTSCVVAGILVNFYNVLHKNRITRTSVLSERFGKTFEEKRTYCSEKLEGLLGRMEAELGNYKTFAWFVAILCAMVDCVFW